MFPLFFSITGFIKSFRHPQGSVILLLLLFMATLVPSYAAMQSGTTDTTPSSSILSDEPDWDTIAAETIGIDEDTLEEALENGQTIAEVALEEGVEPQVVIDAIIAAQTEWIKQQLADGEITQEEADELLAELPFEAAAFVGEADDELGEAPDWFTIAAQTIGIDEDTFWEALNNGQTIAEVATEHTVDPQTVIDAIIAAETEWINQLVADGTITQEEADELLATLPSDVAAFVEADLLDYAPDWFTIAAQTIGIDEDTLWEALDNGQTIAEIATEHTVDPQTVIDAIITAQTEWIKQQVADGDITQEEADELLAELPSEAAAFVGEADDELGEAPDWFAIAAQTIGIDEATLQEALDNGQSIAEVATEHEVEPQAVIDAIITAQTEWIKQQVADGTMTQEEADELLAELPSEAAVYVEGDNGGGDGDYWDNAPDWFAIAAQTIGIDEATLQEALDNGQSIAEVATEHEVEPQAVIDAIITAQTEWIKQQVADGTMTQEEADELLAELPSEAAAYVEGDNGGGDGDAWDNAPDWFAVAAQTIGIDEDTLENSIENGQTIGEVATEYTVEPQAVIDAIIAAQTEWIKQLVANDLISQEEADEWLAELSFDAASFVENTHNEDEDEDEDHDEDWDDNYWFSIAAQTIGIDEDTLENSIENGQTIAQVATEHGVDPQDIVDAIVAYEAEWINELVADDVITQEEADEWLAEIEIDAMMFVQLENTVPSDSIELDVSSGENSINLSWTVVDVLDNPFSYYEVLRSDNTVDYTVITNTIQSLYTDHNEDDEDLTEGTEYCYQIKAYDSDDNLIGSSNSDCVKFGALTLWVPDEVVEAGSSVMVPINLANGNNLCGAAMDITVSYNTEVVTATGTVSPTIYTEGYAFAANTNKPGEVSIATITGDCHELYGGGSLFVIGFDVIGNEGDVSLVDFIEGLTGTVIYDEENLFTPVDLTLQNGSLTIGNAFIRGDVNGDGAINSADAARALLIDSGLVTPTAQQLNACDVNGDGACNAADASLILCYAAFEDWNSCGGSTSSQRLARQAQAGAVNLSIGTPKQTAQSIVVPVNLTNASNFAGGSFIFTYDASKMTATGASLTDLTDDPTTGFQLRSNVQKPGILQVSLASQNGITANGAILELEFTTINGISNIDFGAVRLNDTTGRDFERSALQSDIQLTPYHNTSSALKFTLFLPSILR